MSTHPKVDMFYRSKMFPKTDLYLILPSGMVFNFYIYNDTKCSNLFFPTYFKNSNHIEKITSKKFLATVKRIILETESTVTRFEIDISDLGKPNQ